MVVQVRFASVMECVAKITDAFRWDDTPQGYDYWYHLATGRNQWDDEAYENIRVLLQQSIDFYGAPYNKRKRL